MSRKHREFLKEHRHRYDDILASQQGGCAICGRSPSIRRRLDLDHDHRTMVIRGLLCHKCNRVLVSWVDSGWLRKAAEYLEREPLTFPDEADRVEE